MRNTSAYSALACYVISLGWATSLFAVEVPPAVSMAEAPWTAGMSEWKQAHLDRATKPPFSFTYGGKPFQELLKDWEFEIEDRQLDAQRTRRTTRYLDPATGLQVSLEATLFHEFPAVDWVLRFKNTSQHDTPIVADVRALDTAMAQQHECTLHHLSGCREGVAARPDDFSPQTRPLVAGGKLSFAPLHGRSSWGESLPFFNVEMHQGGSEVPRGVVLGIGWTGQWKAEFERDDESLSLRAGMEQTHLKLRPGEEIRTPKILLVFWQGHRIYGQNLLRRMIVKHYHPQRDGKPVMQPFLASSAAIYHEAFEATPENQLAYAEPLAPLGFEYLWMDVGWHVKTSHLGPPDPQRFPNGLRPLSDGLEKLGMGLLAWHAPEYQGGGSWMERDHPELFLSLKDPAVADSPPFKILNFGDPTALKLITDYTADSIRDQGIGIYRLDGPIGANLMHPSGKPYPHGQPLKWWRDADEHDRQGIAEIRYVEGFYWFLDEIVRRNPGLIIDLCGGGASRIDLESMSRCFYLWRSDWDHPGFEPNGHQSHTYGLSQWTVSTGICSGYPDAYSTRSAMNAGMAVIWNPFQPEVKVRWPLAFAVPQAPGHQLEEETRPTVDGVNRQGFVPTEPFPWKSARGLAAEFLRVRHLFHGDFYPLTPLSHSNDVWIAYQLHREDLGEGMVLAFRREDCHEESMVIRLWGLTPELQYELDFGDSAKNMKQYLTGEQLAEGFRIATASQPGSLLISYRETQ